MTNVRRKNPIAPAWWTAGLVTSIVVACIFTATTFAGTFRSYVSVWLVSDRSGLVMEPGAKIKMSGVEVGRVASISGGQPPRLKLDIFPDQIKYIPANVQPKIRATTAFGAKYIDFEYPTEASQKRLTAGAVLRSKNVTTEINTVFENLVGVLKQVDPPKLNSTLTAIADAVRGKGTLIGKATTAAAQVVSSLNTHSDAIDRDFRSLRNASDAYAAAAHEIIAVLDAGSVTSATIASRSRELDTLLLNAVGFSRTGIEVLEPSHDNLIRVVNQLAPTTDVLNMYSPEYTCTLLGAKWIADNGTGGENNHGNGYSIPIDVALGYGLDLYKYPDNLPKVGAKGGPGGKPGCGSLPEVAKDYPVRYLVTDTGWGTGVDVRPNPGIGSPCFADYFPVTRAVPAAPSIRQCLPGPAPGPVPYPGAPPCGAPLFGSDGAPLWATPPPGAPPPPVPGMAVAPPPYGPPGTEAPSAEPQTAPETH